MAKKTVQVPSERKKRTPRYRSFRLSKPIPVEPYGNIPPAKVLWKDTWQFIWKNKKQFLIFWLIYTVLYLIVVKGISGFKFDAVNLKVAMDEVIAGHLSNLLQALAQYASLISSITATTSDISNYTQITALIIFSLAFIRLLRSLHSKRHPGTVKLAFYEGMRPLIPFVLVIAVMLLELIPAGFGLFVLYTAQGASVVTTDPELLGIAVIAVLLLAISLYLLSGSIFSLYIVTIKKMQPIQSLRISMRLLHLHRWIVFRRLIMVIIFLLLVGFLLTIPVLAWVPQYTEQIFFVLVCGAFAVIHTYMYKLYRILIA